jgi:hypothetical protein
MQSHRAELRHEATARCYYLDLRREDAAHNKHT